MSAQIANKLKFLILTILIAFSFSSCKNNQAKIEYKTVSASDAKNMMTSESNYIILDVRTDKEFEDGHIENAILIPDTEISERAETELTDKNQLILVYCRTGRRSAASSAKLAELGYTNVIDFGGILDWPYEIVK